MVLIIDIKLIKIKIILIIAIIIIIIIKHKIICSVKHKAKIQEIKVEVTQIMVEIQIIIHNKINIPNNNLKAMTIF